MKRIFSILIALVLVFSAIPVLDAEALMQPENSSSSSSSSGSSSSSDSSGSSDSSSGSSGSSSSSSTSASSSGVYRVTYYPGEAGGDPYIRRYSFFENFETVSCPFEYKDHVFAGWEYDGEYYPEGVYEAGVGFRAPNVNVSFTAVWKKANSSSSTSSVAPPPSSSTAPAPSTSSKPSSSSSSSSESSEPESSESSSSVVEVPEEDVFEPVSLAFSINGDIPVSKIEFLLKEDIGGEPTISIVPLDGYSVTDSAAAKFIADGDALAAFDISLLSDGMAYKGNSLGTVIYTLNGTQATAESNYDSYVFAMVHTVSADKHVGEYYMTDGELVYLYNPETDFKTAVDNVKLVEEDGIYRLVIKDPSGLSSFAYEAAEGVIVEVKLVASASAESASIDVTSLSPVLLAHIEVGEGKSSGAGIPVWVWIVVAALVLVVGVLVALFLISRRSGNSSSSEKTSSGSYSGITGFDEE